MNALFDGKRAKRHDAAAAIVERGLAITGVTIDEDIVWPFDAISVIAREGPCGPWTLMAATMPRARLRLEDGSVFDGLLVHRPELAAARPRYRGMKKGLIVGGFTAGIVALSIALIPILSAPIAALVPARLEREFGRDVIDQAIELFASSVDDQPVCNGAAGLAALDRLALEFSAITGSRYSYDIAVLDDDMINAFAAPGGWILLTRGLINNARSGNEVAATLAHEMAHVELRHGMKSIITSHGRSILLSMMGFGMGGSAAELSAMMLLNAGNSRQHEAAADRLANTMLNATGIGTVGMAEFLERLDETTGGHDLGYLATHPDLVERAVAARERQGPQHREAFSADEWRDVRSVCD
jgi:Zn-dependent protease with chaperone function